MPFLMSRATNASAFSNVGYSQAEPPSQNDRFAAPGRVTSWRARITLGGNCGRNVPGLKRMPSHSPPAGHVAAVMDVSGPRTVRNVSPRYRVTASSQFVVATDRNSRSEEHTSELQSRENLVCRLLLEKKKKKIKDTKE